MEFVRPQANSKNRNPRPSVKKGLFIAGCAILTAGIVIVMLLLAPKNTPEPVLTQEPVEQLDQVDKVEYVSVEGRYLFHGTIVLARAVERYARGDYSQPFSQMSTFEPQLFDAQAADFECPITNNVVPYERQVNNLVFNCRPEWLPELTKYVQLFNLANNHTGDMGFPEGFEETKGHLQKAGVQYFGNYDPTIIDDICEVIALPVRLQKQDNSEVKAELPVAFCSWHYFNFNRGPTPEELAPIKKYAARMPVFAFVEMGNEYQATASRLQQTIARSIIDEGADFVMANNPHWVQNTESYKGKLIVYSLGNFIFDQIDAETQRGVSMDTTIRIPYDDNIASWLSLGPSCKAFKDDCLQQSETKNLKKISYSLSYSPIASQGGAGKITRRATDAVQKAVEQRMDWARVSALLSK